MHIPTLKTIALLAALNVAACSTPSPAPAMPADAKVTVARVISKARVEDASASYASSRPSVGVGGGGVSGPGIGSGGFFGGGIGFDLSDLFTSRSDAPAIVYRYRVQMPDGATREIDSPVDVPVDRSVDVIESGQPGYPRLRDEDSCPQ